MVIRRSNHHACIYRIDHEGMLIYVNETWTACAEESGAGHLTLDTMRQRPLWRFIADTETRHLYKLLVEKVRETGLAVTAPFRCDSPDRRRFMELEITLWESDIVQFESRLIRQELREPVALLDASNDRLNKTLKMCSWCKRIDVGPYKWVEVEDTLRYLDLFGGVKLPRISHAMCPHCRQNFLANLKGLDQEGSRREVIGSPLPRQAAVPMAF